MENNIISIDNIENLIYEVRGVQVMLDSDLARIYGYTTKTFNQQVKNNIERFDKDFRFQLTDIETKELSRSKNLTLNHKGRGNNIKYNPYVFTEEGVYMLMTILKGELAVEQSKKLIRIFKGMKNYIVSNKVFAQDFINKLVIKNTEDIKELKEIFNKLNKNIKKDSIFYAGQFYDAYSLLLDIFNQAKKEIIIIDNYAGKELLDLLKDINKKIIIVSSNIDDTLKEKYLKQYSNVTFINNTSFHDRFIIIDKKKLYTCGSSFKDIGKKCTYIGELNNKEYLNELLKII